MPPGFHFSGFVDDGSSSPGLHREFNFDVTGAFAAADLGPALRCDVGRDRRALFFRRELLLHSDERQISRDR